MRYLLFIVLLAMSYSYGRTCNVLTDMTVPGDTTLIISSGRDTLSCVTNTQLREFLITDSSFGICNDRLNECLDLVRDYEHRRKLEDSSYAEAVSSAELFQKANKNLVQVNLKTDTLLSDMKQVRTLTEGKLERCEKDKTSLWMATLVSIGFFVLGMVLGSSF